MLKDMIIIGCNEESIFIEYIMIAIGLYNQI